MLGNLFRIHILAILAVVGSLVGSILLFVIGTYEMVEAILIFFGIGQPVAVGDEATKAVATTLSALDNYLIGFVLLYFAYNLYFLITYPEQRERHFGSIKMPPSLELESLGQMKKTMLTLIVVSLSVFLLKEVMRSVDQYEWADLFIPLSIVAVAAAIKMIKFAD